MSVLIRGMEMPTNCRKCGFYHHSVDYGYYDFEYCGANNQEFNNAYDSEKPHINPFEEKLSDCPLVNVPPHYELIDQNALKIAVMNGDCETRVDFLKHTLDCINKAPVVIPSDMPTYEEEGEI